MNAATYKALSGAIAQTRRLEVISQNLANLNTTGYKTERLAFNEIFAETARRRGRMGGLVAVGEQLTDFSPGGLQHTGNPFDLAIEGEGFFALQTPRGIRYSRQGIFTLSSEGTVVTPLGDPLLGETGPLQVSGTKVTVTAEGEVLADGVEAGKIRVVRFANPRLLTKEGHSLFRAPEGAEEPASTARLLQGNLEQANVNPIEAMVTMITVQRQFDAYQRAIQTMDAATERMLTEGARV
jgi:flagellar basal-body rod protein FlgF